MTAITARHYAINRIIWATIATLMAIDGLLLLQSSMNIDFTPLADTLWVVALMISFCLAINIVHPQHLFPAYNRALDGLWSFTNFINQMIFVPSAIALFSYLTARANLPLIDDALITIDRFLGFDWLAHIAWANARPFISDVFSVGYNSFNVQIMLLLGALPLYGQFAHAQRFVIVFFSTALITVILSALFPATGAYIHYNIDAARDFPYLHNMAGLAHKDILLGLRDHTLTALSFPLLGIVTFPSFHTALAVMLSYGFLPFRRLRFVVFVLNTIMIISTPMEGGHYLVDVIAGVVIAIAGIYAAERLAPNTERLKPRGLPQR